MIRCRCRVFVFAAGMLAFAISGPGCMRASGPMAARPSGSGKTSRVGRPRPVTADAPDPPIAPTRPVESAGLVPALPADATPHFLTNASQHTFASEGRNFDPDVDSQGKWLVFASTRNSVHPDIFLKRVDGYALRQLTHDPADDVQPRFSPDGQRIVFASNRSGNWDLWIVSLDGTGLVRLTDDPTHEIAPAWSPDGKQVAYTAWGRRSGQWEIWTVDVSRPSVRRFLTYGMFPDWSADGRFLAFQRARQRGTRHFSVWTAELIDGEARNLTEVAYNERLACITPRWSPDGSSLVFASVPVKRDGRGPTASVWALDLQSGTRTQLTNGGLPAFNPIWAPSGRVFFVAAGAWQENIWSVAPKLTRLGPPDETNGRQAALSVPQVNAPVSLKPGVSP